MMEINELAKALVAFQGDLEPVEKGAENPFFKSKYADLPAIMKAVQPLKKKHKLAVAHFPTIKDGEPALRTMLIHESGQFLEDVMLLKLAKQDPQGQGSGITYARRYAECAVLGIVADEDDDGNKASTPPKSAGYSPSHEPSDNQLKTIRGMLVQLGTDKEKRDEIIGQVTTFQKASDLIGQLKERVAQRRQAKQGDEVKEVMGA